MRTKKIDNKDVAYQTMQVMETARVKAKWRNKPDEVPAIIEMPTMQQIWDYTQMTKIGKPV
jgi:hypothetical protein